MLKIREAQLDALDSARRAELFTVVRAHIARFFPDDARVLGAEALDRVTELGWERTARHGLELTGHFAHYVGLMFLLGSGFDEDPQLSWAGTILGDRAGDAEGRLAALHTRARAHVRAVAGPRGDRYRRALAEARRAPFSAFHAGALAEGPVRALTSALHPEKHACIADVGPLVALAHEKAAQHGLPMQGEGALCAVALMFLLGAHFDRDPIHPWAAEVLAMDVPPPIKASALRDRALARLDVYFRPEGR